MHIIKTLDELNYYLKETDSGIVQNNLSFLDEDFTDSLTIEFESNGGWSESLGLFICFHSLHVFHIGISLNVSNIGVQIDEMRQVKFSDLRDIIPYKIHLEEDDVCYRFYAQNKPTIYYVICSGLSIWLENYDRLDDFYKFIKD